MHSPLSMEGKEEKEEKDRRAAIEGDVSALPEHTLQNLHILI